MTGRFNRAITPVSVFAFRAAVRQLLQFAFLSGLLAITTPWALAQQESGEKDFLADFPASPNATGPMANRRFIVTPRRDTDYLFDEAMKVDAVSLARGITDLLYIRANVLFAKEGATVYLWLDQKKEMVDVRNADAFLKLIDKRLADYQKAVSKRGAEQLGEFYDLDMKGRLIPTLIDRIKDGYLCWWDGEGCHPIAVVEDVFVINHQVNTEMTFIGKIARDGKVRVEIRQAKPEGFDKVMSEEILGEVIWRPSSGENAEYANAFSDRAEYLIYSGYPELGLRDANEAIKRNPKLASPYAVRSQIFSSSRDDEQRDGKQALLDAEKYCELEKDKLERWRCKMFMANAHAELGDFDVAIEEIESAKRIAPDPFKEELSRIKRHYSARRPMRLPE